MEIDFSGVEAGKLYTVEGLEYRGLPRNIISSALKRGYLKVRLDRLTGDSLLKLKTLLDSTISIKETVDTLKRYRSIDALKLSDTQIERFLKNECIEAVNYVHGYRLTLSDVIERIRPKLVDKYRAVRGERWEFPFKNVLEEEHPFNIELKGMAPEMIRKWDDYLMIRQENMAKGSSGERNVPLGEVIDNWFEKKSLGVKEAKTLKSKYTERVRGGFTRIGFMRKERRISPTSGEHKEVYVVPVDEIEKANSFFDYMNENDYLGFRVSDVPRDLLI